MRPGSLIGAVAGSLVAAALLAAPAASAQVQPYRTNDPGGFWNVLPPGQGGGANAAQIAAFVAACPPSGSQDCPNAPRPEHFSDQLRMYGDLVYSAPGLRSEELERHFKDASFGVRDGQAERTYSPRSDVTVVRDEGFGVPHVYGRTREGAMFGLGYVGAEDRLFFMDALRNAGRAQLSSFAGGAQGNRELDRDVWQSSPYTEADLRLQYELGDDVYGAAGRQLQRDAENYVAGINAYIAEARANPLKMPGEYAAIGRPQGPEDWKVTDPIATAALIGGIFGKGGGGELDSALLLESARDRFGHRSGKKVWADFRSANDREAPTTVHGKSFPYQAPPKRLAKGSLALPDRGSVNRAEVVAGGSAQAGASSAGLLDPLVEMLRGGAPGGSNALLVSARESESGRPIAVMGPQVAYFAPQILYEIDVHAPTIDARGATFPGVGLYVLLGRGRDYAWSATSAGQDVIDTFAVELCEPGGGAATTSSGHYLFRGQCRPMETLERRNSWTPNPGDQTPPGSETLRVERTALGLVSARGTVRGKPVAYTKLRSTYFHEADSALGFSELNNPDVVRGPAEFQRAVHKINFTFNWFYADSRDIAYFNSGWNPVRAPGVSNHFPVSGAFEWRDFNTDLWMARYTPFEEHPQAVNQRFLTSWNNKQAPDYRASDSNFAYGSVDRSEPLDDRIIVGTRTAPRKMSLVELIGAMEGAATVDLRADKVLAFALRILGRQRDPELASAIETLRAWRRAGNRRIDKDGDRVYERSEAIRILDAWWPLWMEAQFKPALGDALFERLEGMIHLDGHPNNDGAHLGDAWNDAWYHYAEKDLRTILSRIPARGPARRRALASGVIAFGSARKDVKGLGPNAYVRKRDRYSRVYCGGDERRNGTLRRCRERLAGSLKQALEVARTKPLYEDRVCQRYRMPNSQWCFDAVWHRPIGAISQPLIHWVNRPTFQQAVEVRGDAPR